MCVWTGNAFVNVSEGNEFGFRNSLNKSFILLVRRHYIYSFFLRFFKRHANCLKNVIYFYGAEKGPQFLFPYFTQDFSREYFYNILQAL